MVSVRFWPKADFGLWGWRWSPTRITLLGCNLLIDIGCN